MCKHFWNEWKDWSSQTRKRNCKKNQIEIWGKKIKITQILILNVKITKYSLDDFNSRVKIEERKVEESLIVIVQSEQ